MSENKSNEEMNNELIEWENKRIRLVNEKFSLEESYGKQQQDYQTTLKRLERDLIETNQKIKQIRRTFKIQGNRRFIKNLRLSSDAKDLIINEVKQCEGTVTKDGAFIRCPETDKSKLTVHHETPLSQGGTNERANLKVLCVDCHRKYHRI